MTLGAADVVDAPRVDHVRLAPDVDAWFTGRAPGTDEAGSASSLDDRANLSHRRPHVPAMLAESRQRVADAIAVPVASWDLMHQVHGATVRVVPSDDRPGAEWPDCDGLVTVGVDRALVVLVADCVPLLLAGPRAIAAVHVGWRGAVAGVVEAAIATMVALGDAPGAIGAAVGPSIGPCCYEVGDEVVRAIAERTPDAVGRTRQGSPAVDVAGAVTERLADRGVTVVERREGCTRCDAGRRWFSHRADPACGRQAGIVVRRGRETGAGS